MFSYYGGKGRVAKRYPAPRYPLVIEPFSGAAWYSVLWEVPRAMLFDVDENIAAAWDWILNRATEAAISAWPPYIPRWPMERFSDRGEDTVYRFNGNSGSKEPWNVAGQYCTARLKWERVRRAQAGRWSFSRAAYTAAPDVEATWFIDPPYQQQSRYRCNDVDYRHLAEWCRSRRGQVIVCESVGATWLPFRPFLTGARRPTGRPTSRLREEAIWTSDSEDWLEVA